MKSLELRIPPPVVALAVAAAMYGADHAFPGARHPFTGRVVLAWMLAIGGLSIAIAAAVGFHRHRTTIDPRKPEKTSVLVTTGVYRFSRNPIYLGDALLLLAWATYLANPLAFILVPAFVAWMNALQIAPEERMLRTRFGDAYAAYCGRVGRWLGRARPP